MLARQDGTPLSTFNNSITDQPIANFPATADAIEDLSVE